MTKSRPIPLRSRRTLLKGLPVSLAGLALVSPLWSRLIGRAVAASAPRQRLLVWYTADGTVPEWFWPSAAGTLAIRSDRTTDLSGQDFNTAVASADRPTFILQPIASYADRTLLVKGINNPGEADHAPCVQSCLTGEAVRDDNTGTSPSLDVLMAEVHANTSHAEPVFRTGVYGNRVSYDGTRDVSRPRGRDFVEPSWQPISDARRVLDAVGGEPDPGADPGTPHGEPPRGARFGERARRGAALRFGNPGGPEARSVRRGNRAPRTPRTRHAPARSHRSPRRSERRHGCGGPGRHRALARRVPVREGFSR